MSAPLNGIEVTWADPEEDEGYNFDDEDNLDNEDGDYDHTESSLVEKKQQWKQEYSTNGICNRKMLAVMKEKEFIAAAAAARRGSGGGTPETSALSYENDDSSILECGAAFVALLQHCDPRAASGGGDDRNAIRQQSQQVADDITMVTMATHMSTAAAEREDALSIVDATQVEPLMADDWDSFTAQLVGDFPPTMPCTSSSFTVANNKSKSKSKSKNNSSPAGTAPRRNNMATVRSFDAAAGAGNSFQPLPPQYYEMEFVAATEEARRPNRKDVMAKAFANLEKEENDNDLQALAKSPVPTFDNNGGGADDYDEEEVMDRIVSLSPIPRGGASYDNGDYDYAYDDVEDDVLENDDDDDDDDEGRSSLVTDPRANVKQQAKPQQSIEVIYDPDLFADIGEEGKSRCALWPMRKPLSRFHR